MESVLMKVTESTIHGIPLIVVEGDLDQSSKRTARDVVNDVLRGPFPARSLLFDLTDCTFLDSGGLGVLLSALAQIPAGGWLGIIGASAGTNRVLTYTGFLSDDKVRFFSSPSDAAASLARERRLPQSGEPERSH
jgi:anti-anti-sigma factor